MSCFGRVAVLGLFLVAGVASSAKAAQAAYCSVYGHNDGGGAGQFWVWTMSSVPASCTHAEQKLQSVGLTPDTADESGGYYLTDGNNTGSLQCDPPQEAAVTVTGVGTAVFTNAQAMKAQNGWSGCSIVIQN